jgi:hypothetical protein
LVYPAVGSFFLQQFILNYTDLLPHNDTDEGWENTRKFLEGIVQILLEYIRQQNDRKTKGGISIEPWIRDS